MLIHSDGNSNIRQGSCFALADWIKEAKPNVILMNPPYNGQRIHLPKSYVNTWSRDKKEDPSKGMYFVKFIADTLNSINHHAKLAVLLPVACAIGTSGEIARLKRKYWKKIRWMRFLLCPTKFFIRELVLPPVAWCSILVRNIATFLIRIHILVITKRTDSRKRKISDELNRLMLALVRVSGSK